MHASYAHATQQTFWDKFERANFWLNCIIETASDPIDDRTVAFLLDHIVEDGMVWYYVPNQAPKIISPRESVSLIACYLNHSIQ